MKRSVIEKTTASLTIFLVSAMTLGVILMIGNVIFEWDLFDQSVERVFYFISFSMLVVSIASAAINIMINISRLAYFSEVIARKLLDE